MPVFLGLLIGLIGVYVDFFFRHGAVIPLICTTGVFILALPEACRLTRRGIRTSARARNIADAKVGAQGQGGEHDSDDTGASEDDLSGLGVPENVNVGVPAYKVHRNAVKVEPETTPAGHLQYQLLEFGQWAETVLNEEMNRVYSS